MGIVNLTPDSFSDGGSWRDHEHALDGARAMVDAGADIIDVGGESTRPGAGSVSAEEQLRRILPFISEAANSLGVPVSVDTRLAEVAVRAVEAGAEIVNDVSGMRFDEDMAPQLAELGSGVVLMHSRGTPEDMATLSRYGDLVREVRGELQASLSQALAVGVLPERVVLDPGIGFAKSGRQSLALLDGLSRLLDLGCPLLVGPSRKSFIGEVTGEGPGGRLEGTISACVIALERGARLFRVHDVEAVHRALEVAHAILLSGGSHDPGGSTPAPQTI
jgi:dihydropteroate synthase